MVTIGNIIGNTIGIILKKPFIIVFWGVLMLAINLVGYLLPVFRTLFELGSISGSNPFEALMSFIQLIYSYLSDIKIVAISVVVLVLVLISIAVISGALMSGYLFKLNNAVSKKAGRRGEFSYGVRQYFNKISLMNFNVLVIGLVILTIIVVASVPALVITSASTGKGREMLPTVLFVDVLTGVVLFFGLMFYRIYAFFWYPAAINNGKKPFKEAKHITNKHFWKIVLVFAIFDLVYIAFQMLFVKLNENIYLLALKWVFTSIFYAITTYIFTAFKKYSNHEKTMV